MTRIALFLAACLPLVVPVAARAADTRHLQGLGHTEYRHVESEIVGRGFHVYVMLPEGYASEADRQYPTVYLLDGGNLFPMLVPYYRYLNFAGEAPDAIIVGIAYGSDRFEGGNFRSTDYTAPSEERDFWGGAGKFQPFLSDELIPSIEADYRSRADRRVVFGQSLGGQFVLYTAMTRPDLFWGHIASNPALHRNLDFFLAPRWPETPDRLPAKLFVASASNDDPGFRGPAVTWMDRWSDDEGLPWVLETVTLDGHSHMSAPPASFRRGMRWLFDR